MRAGARGRRRVAAGAVALAMIVGSASAPAAGIGPRAEPGWPLPVHDDTAHGQVLFDRFEYQAGEETDVFLWDAQAWYGGDIDRLWLETEGRDVASGGEGGEIENLDVLWSHRFDRFWDVQAGLGYQTTYGPGPDRDRASLVIGFQGMAPYWFEIDTNLRLSEDGDAALDLEAEYDWRLTQRWVLQARGETAYALDAVPQFETGEGLTGLTAGLRLRYHLAREVAPYAGVTWSGRFGDTRDLFEREGEDPDAWAGVVGVRWWF